MVNLSDIVIKRNLIIFRRISAWDQIYDRILAEHSPSIKLSWVLKRELGFTIRNHEEWVPFNEQIADSLSLVNPRRGYLDAQIHLDFYSEAAQSWFQLKYLNC